MPLAALCCVEAARTSLTATGFWLMLRLHCCSLCSPSLAGCNSCLRACSVISSLTQFSLKLILRIVLTGVSYLTTFVPPQAGLSSQRNRRWNGKGRTVLLSSFSTPHHCLFIGQSVSFVLESGFSSKIHWTAMATNIEYNLLKT